jgi:LysM repeat protein
MFSLSRRSAAAPLLAATLLALGGLRFAEPSSGAAPSTPYTVRSGDTLWSIAAARYGGDPRGAISSIRRENGLTDATLRVGQVLVLPSAS